MVQLPQRDFAEPDTIRLISTAYIAEPAMAPLADDPTELSILEEIETLTSARHTPHLPLPFGITQDELVTAAHGFGWTYINAAFCYTRAGGNRFNGEERGAWYAAYGQAAVKTAQAEVAWHLTQELIATATFENLTAYRELRAGFSTRVHDASAFASEPFLDPDPSVAYPHGQALARTLLTQKSSGLVYPSVRFDGGECLAVFRPAIIQNIRLGDCWHFEWSGSPQPTISKAE
ncbi:RES family NAD+ phosphorylase [Pelagibacterium lentulum]|uniref:RES domain-containing protein n=1 Tax=Pelagibacterium lentulum TaxID=2029865 RepID=A0A916RDX5_9HYPH|nr:RES family NAD+ phosphorylase [Pelagibacterium lentulum]GGA48117.1 hypothetical protein GCM10011499_17480 [Pelagibacterium lentulum]